jgi:Aldehyde dehydrogenase family
LTPPWTGRIFAGSLRLLRRLGDLLEREETVERLAVHEVLDNGKVIREMLGQARSFGAWCHYYAGLAETVQGDTIPVAVPNMLNYTLREPLGVVGAIVPWNSPVLLLLWKLCPALAAGNTVVVKPSEVSPASTLELASVVEEAGFPPGVVNVVTGLGEGAGAALVRHPEVAKIAFTGSSATGQAVMRGAAEHLARVSLELGGKSPNIIFDDADLANAVSGVLAGVLWQVGDYLGRLAGRDLTGRCRLGSGADRRADRKRALTADSSSRWAGAITRTSNDQWVRAYANLRDTRVGLRRAIKKTRARLAVPVGQTRGRGRVQGYHSQAERFQKQRRVQHLQARLAEVEARIAQGRVSVCRGGRRLAELHHAVAGDAVVGDGERGTHGSVAKMTQAEWRARWRAERLFLTADGEADKVWGNETIRIHPDERWLEIRLPTPLAHLSNTPGRAATYRLSCQVAFTHRASEWAAQAASGAVRYDLLLDPARGRWYVDASWQLPTREVPPLEEVRQHRALGVDLNAGHLDCWVLDASGNPVGVPHTIPLELDGLSATTRDGRLRAAVATVMQLAKANGCRSIVVENLDFADARHTGRETLGRGARGKAFRRTVAGIPTRQFRELLVGMATNTGLWVVAVDPGWTSKWGQRHWQRPLQQSTTSSTTVTGHHAAAVVIGRRGLGLGARGGQV